MTTIILSLLGFSRIVTSETETDFMHFKAGSVYH